MSAWLRNLFWAFLILLVTFIGCSQHPTATDSYDTYKRAYDAYERKHYLKAERLAAQAAEQARKSPHLDKHQIVQAFELAALSARQYSNTINGLAYAAKAAAFTDKSSDPREWARIHYLHGRLCAEHGQYSDAERLLREVVDLQAKELGPEHADTRDCRLILARALYDGRKYVEAEQEWRALIGLMAQALGPEHPDTLTIRMMLGVVLHLQRKYAEAEAENRSVLPLVTRVFGAEHLTTLKARSNLANDLDCQRKHQEADTEYQALIQIKERVVGPNHPDFLLSLYNYAVSLENQEKLEQARQVAWRSLEGRRKVFGGGHPETKKAEQLYERLSAKK